MNIEQKMDEAAAEVITRLEGNGVTNFDEVRGIIGRVIADKLTDSMQVFHLAVSAGVAASEGNRGRCIRELELALSAARAWHARCEGVPPA